ncbi:hypothetical protein VDGD_21073 [Verticillium dahliae]|nr:hypothetical protein VDGD_21073 [Verticillium dahliae]
MAVDPPHQPPPPPRPLDPYAFTFESIPDRRSVSNNSHLEPDSDVRSLVSNSFCWAYPIDSVN